MEYPRGTHGAAATHPHGMYRAGASVWITPRKPAEARGFVEALRRYPTQVAIQCRKEPLDDGDHPADVCMSLQNWLHRAAPPSSETAVRGRADTVATRASRGPAAGCRADVPRAASTSRVVAVERRGRARSSRGVVRDQRKRPAPQAGLYELQLAAYSRHVDRLTDATGALNKIISTPLPISYSRHTSRALSIWCGTLPCAIGSSVGPTATIVVVALVSWLVLGISAVGELLEQPFSQPENVGEGFDFGLPVESLGRSVADEIERLGTREGGALAAG